MLDQVHLSINGNRMPTLTGLKIAAQLLSQSLRTIAFEGPPVEIKDKTGACSEVLNSRL